MRAESPRQKHHIAAPHTYLSNAMKRAVGALKRTGGFTIPGAVPQADIKRAFGPKLTARPHHQPLTRFQSHPGQRVAALVRARRKSNRVRFCNGSSRFILTDFWLSRIPPVRFLQTSVRALSGRWHRRSRRKWYGHLKTTPANGLQLNALAR